MACFLDPCSLSPSCNKEEAIIGTESSHNLSPQQKSSGLAMSILDEIQAYSFSTGFYV